MTRQSGIRVEDPGRGRYRHVIHVPIVSNVRSGGAEGRLRRRLRSFRVNEPEADGRNEGRLREVLWYLNQVPVVGKVGVTVNIGVVVAGVLRCRGIPTSVTHVELTKGTIH